MDEHLQTIESMIPKLTEALEEFTSFNQERQEQSQLILKQFYNILQNYKPHSNKTLPAKSNRLPTLLTQGFDNEQIWQQIELRNGPLIASSNRSIPNDPKLFLTQGEHDVSPDANFEDEDSMSDAGSSHSCDKFIADKKHDGDEAISDSGSEADLFVNFNPAGQHSEVDSENEDMASHDHYDSENPDEQSNDSPTRKKRFSASRSAVDDDFFSLTELETFLADEEFREEQRGNLRSREPAEENLDEDFDYFSADAVKEDGHDPIMFQDFFDPPQFTARKPDPSEKGSNTENADQNEVPQKQKEDLPATSFEKYQAKVDKNIADYEEELLAEKSWTMSGETSATNRPMDSLLTEHLDFEHTTKLPPVITEETTQTLESIIKQRIKDRTWDDVIRKEKPRQEAPEFKKRLLLDQEKSKQSLAEVYEQEYLKQTSQEASDSDKTDPRHKEITQMLEDVFKKLDALSNFHFTPRPAEPEVKVVSNLPTIQVEDVAPVITSDANLLAPEEVLQKKKGDLKGATELTVTDRKSARRRLKAAKKARRLERERKKTRSEEKATASVKANKYVKDRKRTSKAEAKSSRDTQGSAKNKSLSSSTAFFRTLHEQVQTEIKSKKRTKDSDLDNVGKKRKQSAALLKL